MNTSQNLAQLSTPYPTSSTELYYNDFKLNTGACGRVSTRRAADSNSLERVTDNQLHIELRLNNMVHDVWVDLKDLGNGSNSGTRTGTLTRAIARELEQLLDFEMHMNAGTDGNSISDTISTTSMKDDWEKTDRELIETLNDRMNEAEESLWKIKNELLKSERMVNDCANGNTTATEILNDNTEDTHTNCNNPGSLDSETEYCSTRTNSCSKPLKRIHKYSKPNAYSRIYVKGLNILNKKNTDGMRITELKNELFERRFKLSKILNISYAGSEYTEFLILEDYSRGFKKKCDELDLEYNEDFDPSLPRMINATEELKDMILSNFIARITRIIEQTAKNVVRNYFTDWLNNVKQMNVIGRTIT